MYGEAFWLSPPSKPKSSRAIAQAGIALRARSEALLRGKSLYLLGPTPRSPGHHLQGLPMWGRPILARGCDYQWIIVGTSMSLAPLGLELTRAN